MFLLLSFRGMCGLSHISGTRMAEEEKNGCAAAHQKSNPFAQKRRVTSPLIKLHRVYF